MLLVAANLGREPSWIPLAVLVALGVVASHREKFYEDETAISGSIVVVAASLVLFRSALLGPILCAAAVGLHWSHIRERLMAKAAINIGATAIPATAAAAFFGAVQGKDSLWWESAAALGLAVLIYWTLNNLVIATVLAIAESKGVIPTAVQLIRSETEMLVFAFAGGLCGLVMLEVNTWVGALALVAVLIAVDVLVISRPRRAAVRMRHPGLAAAVGRMATLLVSAGAAFGLGEVIGPVGSAPIGAIVGSLLVFIAMLVVYRFRMSAWEPEVALGIAWADAPETIAAAVVGSVAFAAGWLAGGIVAVFMVAVALVAAQWRRRRCNAEQESDALAFALVQLALLDRTDDPSPAS